MTKSSHNTVRHTMATELARRGVPDLEIASLLGHHMPNFKTTARYVHVWPEYLSRARKAINDVVEEIQKSARQPIDNVPSRASCVLAHQTAAMLGYSYSLEYQGFKTEANGGRNRD
ncbi:tyrosine-type recombinase/integrase [Gluconacetobacter entanii]|uniref:Tyrosine-type recombinase/integrase n=1 Tax=Gluconacetobacter entanii TaxID=108528 RepID=A0ABT3K7B7_9PROT|nr:tyrosine-type recombinase/integrase [Gluconacetobacter entanii]MCW4591319.1 tyrosine-type recombinase/integrase [Gluconacetobacter entanii]MCW4595561.1 tyrosine-type recombinase/integrase [Gluconacetobacter entanii]NPC90657.1 tyrosine-type recombinase/integrase [Gluconacetobacter entanii]